jgi:hypothetical protein
MYAATRNARIALIDDHGVRATDDCIMADTDGLARCLRR